MPVCYSLYLVGFSLLAVQKGLNKNRWECLGGGISLVVAVFALSYGHLLYAIFTFCHIYLFLSCFFWSFYY